MPERQVRPDAWHALTEPEQISLRTLNTELEQAEQWIAQRSQDMVIEHGLAAVHDPPGSRTGPDDGITLSATILFLAGNRHATGCADNGPVIARFDIPLFPDQGDTKSLIYRSDTEPDTSNDQPDWSSLFLTLYSQALGHDIIKLLSIRALKVGVSFTQQKTRIW